MAWTGLALMVDGQNALNNAQLSNHLNIKSIVIGDGAPPANFRTLKSLVNQVYEITGLDQFRNLLPGICCQLFIQFIQRRLLGRGHRRWMRLLEKRHLQLSLTAM